MTFFTDDMAALCKERVGQKYRPSNGFEGELFFSGWCARCQRDRAMREGCNIDECDDNERCDIIGNTFAYDVDDPKYPSEWTYDPHGQPCCTAFVAEGDPIPLIDTLSGNLF